MKTLTLHKHDVSRIRRLAAAAVLAFAAGFSFAQPGTPDPSFGTNGTLTTPIGAFGDRANAVALQTDQKIVVGGYTQTSFTASDFAVVRYLPNGDPDPAFGTGGKVTTPIELRSQGNALAIQPDGKILLAGASDWYLNLARYNTDGSPDTTFGTGGKVITDVEGYYSERCEAVAILDDGKILAAGYAQHFSNDLSYFLLVRYNPDGSLDSTFAVNGTAIGAQGQAHAMAVQPDGKIVLGGRIDFSFALGRYTANGDPDPAFGVNGTMITPLGGSGDGRSLVLQPDGKILLAGTMTDGIDSSHCALARYNSDGTPDTAFGQDGTVTASIGTYAQGNAARIQADGKIVLAGVAKDSLDRFRFAVVRYTTDGSFDNTFGAGGKTITAFGPSYSTANALALQDDGRIVLAGVHDTNNIDIALARYFGDEAGMQETPKVISIIYPNPAGGAFTVRLSRPLQNGALRMRNACGQLVMEIGVVPVQETQVLAGELAPGMYYLQVLENDVVIAAEKLVIAEK